MRKSQKIWESNVAIHVQSATLPTVEVNDIYISLHSSVISKCFKLHREIRYMHGEINLQAYAIRTQPKFIIKTSQSKTNIVRQQI